MMFLCIECGKNLHEIKFYRTVKNKTEDCLNKKLKCQVCGKFFTKKWLNSHIERENQPNVLGKPFKNKMNIIFENANKNNGIFLPEKEKHDSNPIFSTLKNLRHVF